jgi:hypothetical protein
MTQFSPFHWLVVFAIVGLLSGGKRLPEIMRELGDARRGGPPPPSHPLPVASPIETSRGVEAPDKPVR